MPAQSHTYLVVLDFEATCDQIDPPSPQEIIEFPSVLVRTDTFDVVDEFESFVRPVHHPILQDFCTELTGIAQTDVAAADPFAVVLHRHLDWLASHGLPTRPGEDGPSYTLVTCGDWDLMTAFPNQCRATDPVTSVLPVPYRQ